MLGGGGGGGGGWPWYAVAVAGPNCNEPALGGPSLQRLRTPVLNH